MPVSDAALSPSEVVGLVEAWAGLREMGLSIDGCKLKEVRPTEDGETEVEYRFKLAAAGSDEILKTTVHGKFYRDDGGEMKYAGLLERMHGTETRSPDGNVRGFALVDPEESLPGFAIYVPEHRLLLESSLTDDELAGLETALDPEAMTPVLARHLAPYFAAQAGAGARPYLRVCEVETLRYKRAKRCTLRYRLAMADGEDGATHPWSLIAKLYGDARKGEQIAAALEGLARHGFGRDAADGIKIPHPYGYVAALQMVLMQDVPGVPMSDLLASPEGEAIGRSPGRLPVIEYLEMAGRTLAKLHRCPATVPMTYDVEDRVSHLARGVAKAIQACPDLAGVFERSLNHISASAGELSCPAPCLIHGSLYPGEFFLGENECGGAPPVTIVDFDTISHGDPAVDVGNFLGHLKRKTLQLGWSPEEARRYSEAFLTAYETAGGGHGLTPDFRQRIDFYRRAVLLKIACRVALRPALQHMAAGLLDEV